MDYLRRNHGQHLHEMKNKYRFHAFHWIVCVCFFLDFPIALKKSPFRKKIYVFVTMVMKETENLCVKILKMIDKG